MRTRMLKIIALTVALLTPLSAFAEEDAKEAAAEYCKCTKESNEQLEEAVKKIKAKDMAGASDLLQRMEPKMKEMEICTSELQKKYSADKMSEEMQKEIVAEIQKTCPAPSMEGLDLVP